MTGDVCIHLMEIWKTTLNRTLLWQRVWTNFASLVCPRRAPSPPLSLKHEAGLFDRDMTARHGGAHARLSTAADCCETHTEAPRERERENEQPLQSAAQAASITGDGGGGGREGRGGEGAILIWDLKLKSASGYTEEEKKLKNRCVQ